MRGNCRVSNWTVGFLVAAGFTFAASQAHAARYNNIIVEVTKSTDSISYDKPGSNTFFIRNETNGTINNIRFRAFLTSGSFVDYNPVYTGAATTCTVPEPKTLDCTITGGLANAASATFTFAYIAPPASSNETQVTLTWDVRFGQGEGLGFITSSSPGFQPTITGLIADNTAKAQAYIPPDGLNLFTGTAVPSSTDPFTVGIVVDPFANKVVTGAIDESVTCPTNINKCAQLDVFRLDTDPTTGIQTPTRAVYTGIETTTDLFKPIDIVLRIAATEVKGKNIRQAFVIYSDEFFPNGVTLGSCSKDLAGNFVPPAVGSPPCIVSKFEYTKRMATELGNPSLTGIWEIGLLAAKNGKIGLGF